MAARRDTAGIIAPPPLIYLGAFALGYHAPHWLPSGNLPGVLADAVGWPLIGVAMLCAIAALHAMRRAHTPVDPYQPSTALVIAGPFRYSRNPLYLSLTLLYLGGALLLNALWAVLLLPVVLVTMTRGVIAREERYLTHRFGAAYEAYRLRVRRWL